MTEKRSFLKEGAPRKFVLAFLIASLAWLCVQSACDRAGWSWPRSWLGSSVQRAAAIQAIRHGEPAAALENATLVVSRDPIGQGTTSLLAESLALKGDTLRAAEAYAIGVASGWRDVAAQTWGVEASLANHEWSKAVSHADAILRASPKTRLPAGWWAAIESAPDGREALASALSRSPPWAAQWVLDTPDLPHQSVANRLRTIELARKAGLSIPNHEAAIAARAMLATHTREALALWHALQGPGETWRDGIWDSNFSRFNPAHAMGPFEWTRVDKTGVLFRFVQEPSPHLEITDMTHATSALLETFMELTTGSYDLVAENADNRPPLRVSLYCLKNVRGQQSLANSFSLQTNRAMNFDIPDSCLLQRLVIAGEVGSTGDSKAAIFRLRVRKRG